MTKLVSKKMELFYLLFRLIYWTPGELPDSTVVPKGLTVMAKNVTKPSGSMIEGIAFYFYKSLANSLTDSAHIGTSFTPIVPSTLSTYEGIQIQFCPP